MAMSKIMLSYGVVTGIGGVRVDRVGGVRVDRVGGVRVDRVGGVRVDRVALCWTRVKMHCTAVDGLSMQVHCIVRVSLSSRWLS